MAQEFGPGIYRSGPIKEQCVECEEWAEGACPCCRRSLCAQHRPRRKRWCPHCEELYQKELRQANARGERIVSIAEGVFSNQFAVIMMFGLIMGAPFAAGIGIGSLLGLGLTGSILVGAISMPFGMVGASALFRRLSFGAPSRVKFLARHSSASPRRLSSTEEESSRER